MRKLKQSHPLTFTVNFAMQFSRQVMSTKMHSIRENGFAQINIREIMYIKRNLH